MLYFPLFDGTLPSWVPFWGGEHFIFFRPVFNIADAAISVGVITILLFQKRFLHRKTDAEKPAGGYYAAGGVSWIILLQIKKKGALQRLFYCV